MKKNTLPKGHPKLLRAWIMYDWANSVYSLTITSAIFPIFYTLLTSKNDHKVFVHGIALKDTALIAWVTAFAFLVVSIISPFLSGIADYVGNKKIFLRFFCYIGALGCIGLYWFDLKNIIVSLLFYFLGAIGYWASLVYYNSYLPDIAYPEQMDRLSARGFSMGYIGSVILLILNLAMVMYPGWFGLNGDEEIQKLHAMRISFLTVGIWWVLFSQYTLWVLPKGFKARSGGTEILLNGIRELQKVWHSLKKMRQLKRFLSSFFIYNMAVQTVMLVAIYFGDHEIRWGSDGEKQIGLIVSILLIQLVAVLGALLTAFLSKKSGNLKVLFCILIIWILICLYAYSMTTPYQFYLAAVVVGLVMGGVQALSRSTYSKMLPETEDTTSFFSFYDVAEKVSIVIGMGIYAFIDQISSMRHAVLFILLLFILGAILLKRVPKISTSN